MVHSLSPSMIHQLRIRLHFAARLLGRPLQDEAHYRAFVYQFFRSIFVPKFKMLMREKDVIDCVADGYLGWAAEEAARAEGLPFVLTPYVHPGQHGD